MATVSAERLSVIIPALDEESGLAVALESARGDNVEIIVADGGSADGTVNMARRLGAQVITAPRGRARQMNAGAAAAGGEIFVFLHADTCLPEAFDGHVRTTLAQPGVAGGAFELAVDSSRPALRLLERMVRLRSRRFGMPYGDQAIFVRRRIFEDVGGFPELAIMEDFELVRRLRRRGLIAIAPAKVRTSARRWQARGLIRTTVLNQCIIAAHLLGVPDGRLARWRSRGLERDNDPGVLTAPGCSRSASP